MNRDELRAGLYRHYKGGIYLLLGVAAHTETGELLVVYVSLDATLPGPRMRARPIDGPEGFLTPVKSHITGEAFAPRFHWIGVEACA